MDDIRAEAELDCIVAFFACSQEIVPIDGVNRKTVVFDFVALEL